MIRWMIRRDLDSVVQIDQASFDSPWSNDHIITTLKQRNCIGQVVEIGETIVGFMIYELHKTKFTLLRLAVHPNHIRKGYGREMIDKLKSKFSPQRRDEIDLEIPDTNLPGQQFLKSQGFRALAVLKHSCENQDVYYMRHTTRTQIDLTNRITETCKNGDI